jgi:copper chaperone CopZ
MKKLYAFVLAFFLLTGFAEAKTIEVHVNGMVCAFCAQGITKKFGARPEVTHTDVNLKEKIVALSLKEGADIKDTEIRSILNDAGYSVESIERK